MIATIFFMIGLGIVIFFIYSYYKSDSILASAITYYESNDEEKAIEMFKNYAVANPKDPKPKWYLAKLYFKKKNYIPALKECISITISKHTTFHEKAEAYALMCEMYIEQNLLEKAAKAATEGIKMDPKNINIHFNLGTLYFVTEKFDKASKEYNFVLSIDRTHIKARLMLSGIHLKHRDETNALFQFKRILEIDPNNKEARFNLAKIYYDRGELKIAVEELEKLTNPEGLEVEYYYMIVNYYLKIKDKVKARQLLEEIAYLNDNNSEKLTFMRYELAIIFEENGELQKAYDLFEKIKLDIPRYKDVDQRIQKLKKFLYPEEHAKIVSSIDYNSLSNIEFEELLAKIVNKLGFKEFKILIKSRNTIAMILVEKFKTILQGKFLIQILRSFDKTGDIEVSKFVERVKDEGAVEGILITTSTFTESAILIAESVENVKLLDKIDIYEIIA